MLRSYFQRARKGLWHLRKGGMDQYREWQRRSQLKDQYMLDCGEADVPASRKITVPRWQILDSGRQAEKNFPNLTVGVILDNLSTELWGPEFTMVTLTPDHWKRELAANPIDFLFVESAWVGNGGEWFDHLRGPSAPSVAIKELVAYCTQQGIPTVMWSAEDPTYYSEFLETAKLFDYVFTTDSQLLDTYRADLGHDRVAHLPFAVQPKIHNPVKPQQLIKQKSLGVIHPPAYESADLREVQQGSIEAILKTLEANPHLEAQVIPQGESSNDFTIAPDKLKRYTVKARPYPQLLSDYRNFKLFVDLNATTERTGVVPPRLMEIIATGSPVVSAPNPEVARIFSSQEVPMIKNADQGTDVLNVLLTASQARDRMAHRARRKIWAEHTYTHRTQQILDTIGIPSEPRVTSNPQVSAIVASNRPKMVEHAIASVGRQKNFDKQLVLVTHGFEVREADVKEIAAEHGITEVVLLHSEDDVSLGQSLNRCVEAAEGQLIAKFDDDDFYGTHYLEDQYHAMLYSGATVVGKHTRYVYVEEHDVIFLRYPQFERNLTDTVAGATLMGYASAFKENPFPAVNRGEDTAFLEAIRADGGLIYSSDRFNFLQVRGRHNHTWNIAEIAFLKDGNAETYGYNPRHVLASPEYDDEYAKVYPPAATNSIRPRVL